uniref:Uncharacterized protein n=1 Tax=Cacopsylla melanoneura TaxID=428564 RepID=A0A8D8SGR6_9HEMI
MFKETVINWERYLPLHLKRLWVQFPLVANCKHFLRKGKFLPSSLPLPFAFRNDATVVLIFFFFKRGKVVQQGRDVNWLSDKRLRKGLKKPLKKSDSFLYFSLESLLSTLLRTFRK